jgi:hypothetical protein
VPPPVAPETAAPETLGASGQPGIPAHPPGTGPSTTPPPGPPGSGSPRWQRSPYSGRHTSDTGPQPALPEPSGELGHSPGQRPGDAPSGPLYIWNPAALTEPFPSVPPPGDAGPPGEGTGETGEPVP